MRTFVLMFIFLVGTLNVAGALEPEAPVVTGDSPLASPEKLIYKAKYLGLPIGEFILVNKGLTDLNNRPAYRFELTVRTLPFFGRIKDFYVTYMDAVTHNVVRHEEYVRGTLESVVDFDYSKATALYTNVVKGRHVEVSIPAQVHDILSGGYDLRRAALDVGHGTEFNIYADEKVYRYAGTITAKMKLRVSGRGKQDALLLKSSLSRNGKPVKALSAEVYFSTDSYRIPYRAVLHTIVGSVAVVLVDK